MNLIAAISRNFIIGRRNKLPWYMPDDLKRFKQITTGNVVIMGKKTFESIKKPLPDRENIVLSSSMEARDDVKVCRTIDECIDYANLIAKEKNCEIFVIGGSKIYDQFLPYVKKLFITVIDTDILDDENSIKFPDFELNTRVLETEYYEKDEKNPFNYRTYVMEVV